MPRSSNRRQTARGRQRKSNVEWDQAEGRAPRRTPFMKSPVPGLDPREDEEALVAEGTVAREDRQAR